MSPVTAQIFFAVALALGTATTLLGLVLQWRRVLERRQAGTAQKLRSTPREAVFVGVGGALIVGALLLTQPAHN